MVSRGLHVVLALAMVALAGCAAPGLEQQVRANGLTPDSLVRLSMDQAVAAMADGPRVAVLHFQRGRDNEGWTVQEIAGATHGGAEASVHLFTLGGESGEEWNSYVFGTAPAEVSQVELDGFTGAGGQVVDGVWVLALREKDLTPDQVEWRFLDALGRVVTSGSGVGPPSS